ncbi:MAG: hypothetical protein R3A11_03250 [Bdellovibrionota bacterium]
MKSITLDIQQLRFHDFHHLIEKVTLEERVHRLVIKNPQTLSSESIKQIVASANLHGIWIVWKISPSNFDFISNVQHAFSDFEIEIKCENIEHSQKYLTVESFSRMQQRTISLRLSMDHPLPNLEIFSLPWSSIFIHFSNVASQEIQEQIMQQLSSRSIPKNLFFEDLAFCQTNESFWDSIVTPSMFPFAEVSVKKSWIQGISKIDHIRKIKLIRSKLQRTWIDKKTK